MFKVGDKVVCINDDMTNCVRKGDTYTVMKVSDGDTYVDVAAGSGKKNIGMFSYRFELVDKKFNVDTATDQELADEYRRMCEERRPIFEALTERGYTISLADGTRLKMRTKDSTDIKINKMQKVSL